MICTYQGCNTLLLRGKVCSKHQAKRLRGRALQRARRSLFDDQPLCVECDKQGKVTLAVQRDHTVAILNGGPEDEANVQALCQECHDRKTATDLGQQYKPKRTIGVDGWSV